MPKTPDEIKRDLEEYFTNRHNLTFEQYKKGIYSIPEVLSYIQQLERDKAWAGENSDMLREENKRLEAENERLKYTLTGVMHFVDKWVEISPYDVEMDHHGDVAVNRAALARKIALEAIEKLETERDAAIADMTSMAEYVSDDVCEWCDQTECECGCAGTGTNSGFKWRGVQKEE